MDRYVFYAKSMDAKALAAAKKAAQALGANVVRAVAGTMLVEAEPTLAAQLAKSLKGWRYSIEAKTHRVPERTPLQRARLAASKG